MNPFRSKDDVGTISICCSQPTLKNVYLQLETSSPTPWGLRTVAKGIRVLRVLRSTDYYSVLLLLITPTPHYSYSLLLLLRSTPNIEVSTPEYVVYSLPGCLEKSGEKKHTTSYPRLKADSDRAEHAIECCSSQVSTWQTH
jgi:hypothetical protein